jgi:hypothetical protein
MAAAFISQSSQIYEKFYDLNVATTESTKYDLYNMNIVRKQNKNVSEQTIMLHFASILKRIE